MLIKTENIYCSQHQCSRGYAGINFSRQNLTSTDVRFWRKSIPTLMCVNFESKHANPANLMLITSTFSCLNVFTLMVICLCNITPNDISVMSWPLCYIIIIITLCDMDLYRVSGTKGSFNMTLCYNGDKFSLVWVSSSRYLTIDCCDLFEWVVSEIMYSYSLKIHSDYQNPKDLGCEV